MNKETFDKYFNEKCINDFTEVDAALLCKLCYLDISKYLNKNIYETINEITKEETPEICKIIGENEYLSNVVLIDFNKLFDKENGIDYCSYTFSFNNQFNIIVFRGTTDNITSYYEDVKFSYSFPIDSQFMALDYSKEILKKYKKETYICGHSKGGNLALFSYVFLNEQEKKLIKRIYNFDGPGFPKEVSKDYTDQINNEKVYNLYPSESIVGRMLNNSNNYEIIDSSEHSISQHNLLNWNIEGQKFKRLENFSIISDILDVSMDYSLDSIDGEKIETTFNNIYETYNHIIHYIKNITIEDIIKIATSTIKLNKNEIKIMIDNYFKK